jgi:hypothetical protein
VKLRIVDDLDVDIGKDCEVSLPDYVTRLQGDPAAEDSDNVVVAAGADPRDGKVLLVTNAGRIRIFDARSFHVPDGPAVPCDNGKQVFFQNVDGRWPGDSEGFYADSRWLLENSVNALKDAEMIISYRHENNS